MSNTIHPHAELMLLYAQDAMETYKPWGRWEVSIDNKTWNSIEDNPIWMPELHYRRKPKTIRIGNYEVPEPLQELPACVLVAQVYVVCLHEDKGYLTPSFFISKTLEFQKELIAKQICHLKKEAAELHAKALLSFTTTEITNDQ